MRIFIGPLELAGVGVGLTRGLRALDVTADLRCKHPHPFAYEAQELDESPVIRLWQRMGVWQQLLPLPIRLLLRCLQSALGFPVLLLLARRYDAFIFIFGRTITGSLWDVWLLRRLGKRTVVVFCGSDARPPCVDGARGLGGSKGLHAAMRLLFATWLNARRVTRLEKFADVVVNSPSTAQFHQRAFINWFAMGIPRSVAGLVDEPSPDLPEAGDLRVLHCPSDRVAKGSDLIRETIDVLRAEGVPIKLTELHGVSNQRVMDALRQSHLVCDQLYADTPMAAFASEAAAQGKAALVGGYFAPHARTSIPNDMMPPSAFVHPSALRETLRALAMDRAACADLGRRAQMFVRTQWDDKVVASRYLDLISGDFPSHWWCQPDQVDYVGGCGLDEAAAAWRIETLTRYFGVRALRLGDKPRLEAAFLSLRDRPR